MSNDCDNIECLDCYCQDCNEPWPEGSKFEVCEGSKAYKGKFYITRDCTKCGEHIFVLWYDRKYNNPRMQKLRDLLDAQ